ncbi:hypothetical protein BDQ17DRAFT_1268255, partial [Cyathus striatus]
LMPILDVHTHWSSTHQMMSHALDYCGDIDEFTGWYKDLQGLELSSQEWASVEIVTTWLHAFRQATTQMSLTKECMLLITHAIFCGLQDELKSAIEALPNNISPCIQLGLQNAHKKLSDYYYHFDKSPYYIWAAHNFGSRILYQGLLEDYKDDRTLMNNVNKMKQLLHIYYDQYYAGKFQSMSIQDDSLSSNTTGVNSSAQFPNLYYLTMNILLIPGSAVGVERIFSGGHDTISVCWASLFTGIRTQLIHE